MKGVSRGPFPCLGVLGDGHNTYTQRACMLAVRFTVLCWPWERGPGTRTGAGTVWQEDPRAMVCRCHGSDYGFWGVTT